jgi:hypothetical protein
MANAVNLTTTIVPSKAPNLPIAPVEYSQQYQDQFSNVLRLYFNQIDNDWAAVLGNNGGRYTRFPHISAYDSTSQYALANTTTTVLWSNLVSGSGFTLNANSSATCQIAGVYKIDYSLQFANTDNAIHDADVWLKVNGTNVTESATRFTLQARKSASLFNYTCGYSHATFEVAAGDVITLVWASDKVATANGSSSGLFIEALPASASPYSRPSIPSSIGTIAFVSAPTT